MIKFHFSLFLKLLIVAFDSKNNFLFTIVVIDKSVNNKIQVNITFFIVQLF